MSQEPTITEISAQEAADMLKQPNVLLVDVRPDDERAIAKIENDFQLTQENVEECMAEWDKSRPIIFYCKSGGRSHGAAMYFAENGFTNCHNMLGGVNAWSADVDESIPLY